MVPFFKIKNRKITKFSANSETNAVMLKFSYYCKIDVLKCVLDVDCGGDRCDGELVVVVVVGMVVVVVE